MNQIVTINGKPIECEQEPYLRIGQPPKWRTPIEINGRMVHGVCINGYSYPPAGAESVLYMPGLPGQGTKIWDRSGGNHGTISGAVWKRLPSGLWYLDFDNVDDYVYTGASATDISARNTFEVWATIEANPSAGSTYRNILMKDGTYYRGLSWNINTKQICFVADSGGVVDKSGVFAYTPATTWIYIVGVWSGTRCSLYVNGVLKNTATVDDTWTDSGNSPYYFHQSGRALLGKGTLACVRNVALDAITILNRYNQLLQFFGV